MTVYDDDVVRELEAAREPNVEPPPGFVATVMRGVADVDARQSLWRRWARSRRAANLSRTYGVVTGVRVRSEVRRTPAGFAREGIVVKKTLWAVAGIGGIAIIVALIVGVPSIHSGTEAAIGAAKRYSAPTSASASVPLGDMTAQQFLQSDTFDRLMKDPNTRSVLQIAAKDAAIRAEISSPELQKTLAASPALREALADPAFVKTLLNPDFERAAGDPAFAQAIANPAFVALIQEPALRAELAEPGFWVALEKVSMAKAMINQDLQQALIQPDFQQVMNSKAYQEAMRTDVNFKEAMAQQGFAEALRVPALRDALINASFRALLTQQALRQDLAIPAIQAAIVNQAFDKAIVEPAFASMFTRQEFTASLAQLNLVEKAIGQANLAAAFSNQYFAPALAAPALQQAMASAQFQQNFIK